VIVTVLLQQSSEVGFGQSDPNWGERNEVGFVENRDVDPAASQFELVDRGSHQLVKEGLQNDDEPGGRGTRSKFDVEEGVLPSTESRGHQLLPDELGEGVGGPTCLLRLDSPFVELPSVSVLVHGAGGESSSSPDEGVGSLFLWPPPLLLKV
jgi:hypothetical protein